MFSKYCTHMFLPKPWNRFTISITILDMVHFLTIYWAKMVCKSSFSFCDGSDIMVSIWNDQLQFSWDHENVRFFRLTSTNHIPTAMRVPKWELQLILLQLTIEYGWKPERMLMQTFFMTIVIYGSLPLSDSWGHINIVNDVTNRLAHFIN